MFKNGDRVKCIVDSPDGNILIQCGDTGTVCEDSDGDCTRVRWDHYVEGHNCGGNCDSGYGWSVKNEELEFVKKEETETEIEEQAFLSLILA